MKPLIIIGAGGFGLEVAAYAKDCISSGWEGIELKGFLDDTKDVGSTHAGLPILGKTDAQIDSNALYSIAIGTPQARKNISEAYENNGAKFVSILHPASYIAQSAQIEDGTIAAPFSFVGPEAHIGKQCLLNIYSSVAHESRIGAYSVFGPYAGTHACAQVGAGCFLGAKTVITRDIKMGKQVKVAAGSVIYSHSEDNTEAMGNPARFKPM